MGVQHHRIRLLDSPQRTSSALGQQEEPAIRSINMQPASLAPGHAGDLRERINRTGIGPESAAVALEARRRGRRLRLVAAASRIPGGEVSGSVRTVELDDDDLLARLRGKSNALILHTDLLGDIAIHQFGGDVTMTAYALLSDLVTLRRRI